MFMKLLKAKIHNATVTATELNYHGSITVDADPSPTSPTSPTSPGRRGSGDIQINGAAARLSKVGNRVIVMAFVQATPQEASTHRSKVAIVDGRNKLLELVEHASTLER